MPVTQFFRELTRDDAIMQKSLLAGRLCGQVPVESGGARYHICLLVAAAFPGNIMMSDRRTALGDYLLSIWAYCVGLCVRWGLDVMVERFHRGRN